MGKVIIGTTMSLDGFITGRNGDLSPLYLDQDALRKSEFLQDEVRTTGAVVMGRRSYDIAQGDLTGYAFQVPIFVVTHHPPENGPKGENDHLKVIFVTDGVERAVGQARAAAGEKDVLIIGGADIPRQILENGLADELSIGITPILLGSGLRFFEGIDLGEIKLERINIQDAAGTTFFNYRLISPPDRRRI